MGKYLNILIPIQILFLPGLILLTIWAVYCTYKKKDRAFGMALYIGTIIIVDSFLDTGIYIPGMEYGSIKYSELIGIFLIINNPPKRPLGGSDKLITFLVFIYFMLLLLSSIHSIEDKGLMNFRRLIIPQIIAYVIFSRGFSDSNDYKRFFKYFMILLFLIGLFTFWDAMFDRNWIHSKNLYKPVYLTGRSHGRFGSFFLNPNYMGTFCCLFFTTLLITTFNKENIKQRSLNWAVLLFFCFATVKTQSRGGMLGLAVSLLFYLILPIKKFPISKKLTYILSFLLIFLLFLPGAIDVVTDRFSSEKVEIETSDEKVSRSTVWKYTRMIINQNLVLGIGFGEIPFRRNLRSLGYQEEYGGLLDNPHNSYLEMTAAAGIPIFIIFITMNIILIIKGTSTIYKRKNQEYSIYLAGYISGLIGYLLSIVTGGSIFVMSTAPAYWAVFGLIFSLIKSERREAALGESSNTNLRGHGKLLRS